jgi:hypothetical protein
LSLGGERSANSNILKNKKVLAGLAGGAAGGALFTKKILNKKHDKNLAAELAKKDQEASYKQYRNDGLNTYISRVNDGPFSPEFKQSRISKALTGDYGALGSFEPATQKNDWLKETDANPEDWDLLSEDGGGNFYALNKSDGKVYFLDHEKNYGKPSAAKFQSLREFENKQASLYEDMIYKEANDEKEEARKQLEKYREDQHTKKNNNKAVAVGGAGALGTLANKSHKTLNRDSYDRLARQKENARLSSSFDLNMYNAGMKDFLAKTNKQASPYEEAIYKEANAFLKSKQTVKNALKKVLSKEEDSIFNPRYADDAINLASKIKPIDCEVCGYKGVPTYNGYCPRCGSLGGIKPTEHEENKHTLEIPNFSNTVEESRLSFEE